MKNYLYLDSSHYVQVGVLDQDFSWRHIELTENKKGSAVIHKMIHEVLALANLKLKDIDGLFLASGPGSYTGIRLSEGIAQILEMDNIPVYSFYHYEVPEWCGYDDYHFFSNAFKNEYFNYSFKNDHADSKMITKESFLETDFSQKNLFCITGELDDMYLESTSSLIKEYAKAIFNETLTRGEHKAPYYYRPIEKEFKPSVKQ